MVYEIRLSKLSTILPPSGDREISCAGRIDNVPTEMSISNIVNSFSDNLIFNFKPHIHFFIYYSYYYLFTDE